MTATRYHLSARISSAAPDRVRAPLEAWLAGRGTVRPGADGWEVEADLEGPSARELNRALLSELRRVEKRTRLRAEWRAAGWVERFFDYVPKGRRPESGPAPTRATGRG